MRLAQLVKSLVEGLSLCDLLSPHRSWSSFLKSYGLRLNFNGIHTLLEKSRVIVVLW